MVLDVIVKHKHEIINKRSAEINLYKAKLKPSQKSLFDALKQKRTSFICEIKPASPSQGMLRKQVDVAEVATTYAPFADAISVLADEKFFQGSLNNVKRVSEEVQCPILCKDVVVGPEQVFEARNYGADAVLLMLSVLDDKTYKICEAAAQSLNMDIICEVHNEEEMKRAIKLNAPIIGINNRNLHTLEIDMDTSERLLPLVPKDTIVISESGFASHAQVLRYQKKVGGFLIGSSLMRSPRIDLALRELIFGRVKICGLTKPDDARLAYDAGSYYGGLNFARSSKRFITVDEAKKIMAAAPLSWGGIFVDQPIDEVIQIASTLRLDFVQLHGHEAKDYIRDLRPLLAGECEIWKAVGVCDGIDIPPRLGADLILFDSANGGGSGISFDWALLDKERMLKFGIAGGINAKNAYDASLKNPWLIDIASGSEDGDPRKKSPRQIKEIFAALRG